nr:MAG TPA: hypothetical protein [Ackermannviridae sp.]
MSDFLLDTETLGTDHDALVLNLGIVPFNIDGKDDVRLPFRHRNTWYRP